MSFYAYEFLTTELKAAMRIADVSTVTTREATEEERKAGNEDFVPCFISFNDESVRYP